MAEKGQLSINSENMFPIIKKWLYSDHDIFYREIISNGCDAITKLKKLAMMGETELPADYKARIDVVLDSDAKTISITDNGIGMTADEVKEYINNIAFSGAEAFMDQYKDKATGDQIIGHFGLGFYSSFMVSELVEIDTLSFKEGAEAVHWTCDGTSEFAMDASAKTTVGTTVTMHLTEDCTEFANYYRAMEVIKKYCGFMPTEIYLSDVNARDKDGNAKAPELINDPNPLWAKTPKDCTEEEYKEFYRKVFNDFKEPLFWIHLNMDYPFNLKGILYFPKINLEYESAEGVIKLYNNQVFIADNIKEVIPEFLLLLKGVIDCPDLPLNVSRSALQNDGFARKISDYITKKVADKLAGMCRTDKENYDKYWDDISPFIKYGCLKDDKFCKKMTDYILFKDLDGKYLTLPEALEVNKIDEEEKAQGENAETAETAKAETASAVDENGNAVEAEVVEGEDADKAEESKDAEEGEKEEKNKTIYYVTDEQQQGQYIRMFRGAGMQAFVLNHAIDQPFINQLEAKNEGIHFARIDAGMDDLMKSRTGKKAAEELKALGDKLQEILKKALKKEHLTVRVEKLKDKKTSSILTVDEQGRRMQDMMKMYAAGGMSLGDMAPDETLILNAGHPLVKYISENAAVDEKAGDVKLISEQLYDLAKIQNAPLTPDEMSAFVARANEIMLIMTQK